MSQRKTFSDGEKVCLQELIIKYKLNSPSTISAGNQNVKKRAWSRLVEDYNSIGGNIKRTEAQLKKCWDNLKSRKKNILAIQKRERMKTGGGPFQPRPGPSHEDPALLDAALLDQTDAEMEFVIDSDSLLESQEVNVTPSQIYLHLDNTEERDIPRNQAPQSPATQDTEPEIEIQRDNLSQSGSHPTDYSATSGQLLTSGTAKNIRATVITEEFKLRKTNYIMTQNREQELHKLNIEEKLWRIKAAKETYEAAKETHEAAVLNRKIAEHNYNKMKDT